MGHGAPVVAVDTVFNREVLGDAGVLVASNPQLVADGLCGMHGPVSVRQLVGERGTERIVGLYAWQRVLSRYEVALADAVG
jgi:glycosyltransferase involved in cell wall biosynthesis